MNYRQHFYSNELASDGMNVFWGGFHKSTILPSIITGMVRSLVKIFNDAL